MRRSENLPYSDRQQQGFENWLAHMVAKDLRMQVSYFWFPQQDAFFARRFNSGHCDIVMGVPIGISGSIRRTPIIVRATFSYRAAIENLRIGSFDDPRLRLLRVGVQSARRAETTTFLPYTRSRAGYRA